MKSNNESIGEKIAEQPPREVPSDEAEPTPAQFEFLPMENAYGVCDVNGECS